MEIIQTGIRDLIVIKPKVFSDQRGYFFESFNEELFFEKVGINPKFVQDNQSESSMNVVRGLHFQIPPFEQGKLVRVLRGSAIDVAVDIRKGSPTYGNYFAQELSDKNHLMMWIPPGFAHGFSVLENNTVFIYKCSGYYNKDSERSISWNDSELNIKWGVTNPIISEKDKSGITFNKLVSPFTY